MNGKPIIRQAQQLVADHYGIYLADLVGRRTDPASCRPRFVAYLICRDVLGLSYPVIGRAFGRHHTTVIDGCAAARGLAKRDASLATSIAILRGHLARAPGQIRSRELARLRTEQIRIAERIAALEEEAGRDNVPAEARP